MRRSVIKSGMPVLVLLSAGLTALAPTPAVGGVAPPPSESNSSQGTTADDEYERNLRASRGLASDLATVRERRSGGYGKSVHIGLPVTPAEDRHLHEQDRISDALGEVDVEQSTAARDYGGGWFDPSRQVVHLNFTQPLSEERRRALARRLPAGAALQVNQVANGHDELLALYNRVTNDMQGWRAQGVMVSSARFDVPENSVVVEVTSDEAAAEAAFGERYAGAERQFRVDQVVAGAGDGALENRNRPTLPSHGGIFINRPVSSTQISRCTISVGNALSNSNGTSRYAVTSGHCGDGSWYQDETSASPIIGTMVKHLLGAVGGTTNCDCGIIGPLPAGKTSTQVLVDNDFLHSYVATASSVGDTSYGVGRSVCFSGARSAHTYGHGVTCGSIAQSRYSKPYNGVTLSDQVLTTITRAYDGDSGAPFGDGGNYLGVLHGFDPNDPQKRMLFSRSPNITRMNVSLPW